MNDTIAANRCHHCGDVIGVYEPTVLTGDGVVRETSSAAEPDLVARPGPRYHRACFAALTGAGPAAA